MCLDKALVVNRDVPKVQVGQRVVWVFLQSLHEFLLGGIQLMLDPIRYPNCIMNSRSVGTFRECRLVLLDSFSVPLLIRCTVQLRDGCIDPADSLQRQCEIVPAPAVWFRSSELKLKALDRLVKVVFAEIGYA